MAASATGLEIWEQQEGEPDEANIPVFVYALDDPRNLETFYIGKALKPELRYKQHLADKNSNPAKVARIRQIRQAGQQPVLRILEKTDSVNWEAAEIRWIAKGRKAGWPLTNIAAGGGGVPVMDRLHLFQKYHHVYERLLKPELVQKFESLPLETLNKIIWQATIPLSQYYVDLFQNPFIKRLDYEVQILRVLNDLVEAA